MSRPKRESCLACLKVNIGVECDELIRESFKECISLDIPSSGAVLYICRKCHRQLMEYLSFRRMCWMSFDHLEEIVNNEPKNVSESGQFNVKLEETSDSLSVDEDHKSIVFFPNTFDTEINEIEEDNNAYKSDSQDDYVQDIADEDESDETTSDKDDDEYKYEESGSAISPSNRSRVKQLPCTECGKRFKKQEYLDAHIRDHNGLKPWVCLECNKEFARRSGLDRHKKSVHGSTKGFKCSLPDCDKVYSFLESLRYHIRTVHEKCTKKVKAVVTCVCELCGKSFTSKNSLVKHSYTHNGQWPFKCTLCFKRYATKHKLKEHQMRHEGIKNHVCNICGLRKTTGSELKMHMNYHTKEKTFPCSICGAVFMNVGNRARHVKVVHYGIKEFSCPHCDRSFGKQETLNHHVMTHTGEKPHECNICGKRFIQKTALQTHQKIHTKLESK